MKNHFKYDIFKIFLPTFILSLFFFNATAQKMLLGTTPKGGDGFGTLFRIEPGANSFSSQIKLQGITGSLPFANRLVEAGNGKFYGMSASGGAYGQGVLFEYDFTTDTYTKKKDMIKATGNYPEGSLVVGPAGKLLGIAENGGINNAGVIFEYDYLSDTYIVKQQLSVTVGGNPMGNFIKAANGKFYCVTNTGGTSGEGTIIEYDYATNTLIKKVDMSGANGTFSAYSMVEAPNGKLYGITLLGGVNDLGVIFEYDYTTNIYTKKVDMSMPLGGNSYASLFLAPNGKFYGATYRGGTNDLGVIFEYDYVSNNYLVKVNLAQADGSRCQGTLMQAADGKLYGITYNGGNNDGGVIFQYDYVSGTYTKKIDLVFENGIAGGCELTQASNGKIYGTTFQGGKATVGVIFEYDFTSNTYTKKKDLEYAASGSFTHGAFVKASNGKVYCLAMKGGEIDGGAILEYDYTADTYTKKIDLLTTGGITPWGAMALANNGKLYGLTYEGGANNGGTIFEYDYTSNSYTKKIDLAAINGIHPRGTLLQAGNGKLYGTTLEGGTDNIGVLFEYDYTTNTYTKLLDFTIARGYIPGPELTEAGNGKIYGSTTMGAIGGFGSIFEYDYTTSTFTTKLFLDGTNGESISGAFIEAANNKLYGMTEYGGDNGKGVIFEYDYLTNTYTKKIDLSDADGSSPLGSLLQSANGKLYGMTNEGGDYGQGTLFEYDYSTNTYTKKITFDYLNGSNPYSGLIEIDFSVVPVTLLEFKATRSGNTALLQWKTSQEINNDHIDVERSSDGGSFIFLNRVNATGNSATITNYSFTDKKVLPSKNYYRLKLVSADGSIQYSDIRIVVFDKEDAVVVYPSPAQSQLYISFSQNWLNKNVKLSLYNQSGDKVLYRQIKHANQIECISLYRQATGVYILKLEQPNADILYKKIQIIN